MRILAAILIASVSAAALAAEPARVSGSNAAPRKPRTVTIDVKNAEVLDVLQALKNQCGVKNLVVDPGVGGQVGALRFRDVPCDTAFRIVLRMSGLDAKVYESSLIHVGAARR